MEDEKRVKGDNWAKWGSLSGDVIRRLQAAGIDSIADKWGGLSEAKIQQLKQAGFIGLLELSGWTTLQLENVLGLNPKSSATADSCQKFGWALERLIKELGVDLPGVIPPTLEARRDGLFLTPEDIATMGKAAGVDLQDETEKLTPKDMTEIEARLTEEVKEIVVGREDTAKGKEDMMIGLPVEPTTRVEPRVSEVEPTVEPMGGKQPQLEPQKEEDESFNRLVTQLISEGLKEKSARALAEAYPQARGLEDFLDLVQTEEGKDRISAALKKGHLAVVAFDDLYEERRQKGVRPLGSRKVSRNEQGRVAKIVTPLVSQGEEPLPFLAGDLSNKVRTRLSVLPVVAGMERKEQLLDFAQTEEGKAALDTALGAGWGKIKFDDFSERYRGTRLFGTEHKRRKARKEALIPPPSEPVPLVVPSASEPTLVVADPFSKIADALLRVEAAIDRNTAALISSTCAREEQVVLEIVRPLAEEFGWEEAISQLERIVDLLVGVSERQKGKK